MTPEGPLDEVSCRKRFKGEKDRDEDRVLNPDYEKRMGLIQKVILSMIEILIRAFQQKGVLKKSLLRRERWRGWGRLPDFLTRGLVEFHDIKKVRWEFPLGSSIFLSPCRIMPNHPSSLSIHFTLLSF